MARYAVRIQGEITLSGGGSEEQVNNFAQRIVSCMRKLVEVASAAQQRDGEYEFSLEVQGVSPLDAVIEGSTVLRSGAHDAQVSTGDWPGPEEWEGYLAQRAVTAERIAEPAEAKVPAAS